MLHLFKKVYIEFDTRMSVAHDRVVISQQLGVPMDDIQQQIAGGTLINYGKNLEDVVGGPDAPYSSLVDMFMQLAVREETTDKTTLIFVDEVSFLPIVVKWFKMLLPNIKPKQIQQIVESYVFRQEVFSNAKFSLSDIEAKYDNAELIEMLRIQEFFEDAGFDSDDAAVFLDTVEDSLGIEYLFASYLYNGSHKENLKKRMKPLLTKDLEKYLYELKEILLVHTLNPNLQSQLSMNKTYTFDNLNEIIDETAPLVRVFFDPRLWTRPGLQTESSRGTIRWMNFTADDIEKIREFGTIVGGIWEEEKFYTMIKSDIMKLDFIPYLQQNVFTDEALDVIMRFELAKEHTTGSYNAISQRTVNNYLVDHVIFSYKNNDMDAIKPFTL